MNKIYRFFGRRYSKLILSIKEKKNIHRYSKDIDMTTAHLSNVIDHWAKLGFIEKVRKGRELELRFTELGKAWRELISKFEEMNMDLKEKRNNKNNEVKENEGKSEVVPSD